MDQEHINLDKQNADAEDTYISYPALIEGQPFVFIHQYSYRRVLVRINPLTGKQEFIKDL